jgi:hypothetical protein
VIIEDSSSSQGDDPGDYDVVGNGSVGRVYADPIGQVPTPLEPFEEGWTEARGSWADSPFDPSPPPSRDEGDPYFPTSPGGYDSLGVTGGPNFQARAPVGAGPGWNERSDSPFDPTPPPSRDEGDPYFPTSPGGYDGLGATGGSNFQARAPAGAGPGWDDRSEVSGGRGSPGRARAPASAGAGPVGEEPEEIEEIPPREERFRPAPGEITTSWLTYEPPPGSEGPRRVLLLYQCEW